MLRVSQNDSITIQVTRRSQIYFPTGNQIGNSSLLWEHSWLEAHFWLVPAVHNAVAQSDHYPWCEVDLLYLGHDSNLQRSW